MEQMFKLASGYDRSKNPKLTSYRRMTVDEMKHLVSGDRVKFIARDGTAREVTVNGAPKTWVTRPNDVRVPLKYGLYEYGEARFSNGIWYGETLIVEVTE